MLTWSSVSCSCTPVITQSNTINNEAKLFFKKFILIHRFINVLRKFIVLELIRFFKHKGEVNNNKKLHAMSISLYLI
uniref:Uncharacterized protein n=1 Tax=Schistosoma mansoni TaxID=6183 RepID=A0A5K4FB01_SCHMA